VYQVHAIETNGFELGSPIYLSRQIEHSLAKAPAERVRAILKAVAFDLKVNLPAYIESWININI